jgi:hypothetical protein
MRVNSENMEDMIFLKSIYSYLGGVLLPSNLDFFLFLRLHRSCR